MDKRSIISRAGDYLSALSEGKDPLTGADVPSDDIVKNPRISKLLGYVSGILDRSLSDGCVEDEYIMIRRTPDIKNEERAVEVAKDFIQRLLKSTDPTSGKLFSGSVLQNERISRCLAFTLGQLETLRIEKRPFEMTEEQIDSFGYSDDPISIADIAQRAYLMTDPDVGNELPVQWLESYLVDIMMLDKNGSATPMGKLLGLSVLPDGTVLCGRRMQELLIKNIPVITDKNKSKSAV